MHYVTFPGCELEKQMLIGNLFDQYAKNLDVLPGQSPKIWDGFHWIPAKVLRSMQVCLILTACVMRHMDAAMRT